jgi:Zn finger protein HypA/HybF involved in hydrogenase expression
MGSYDVFKCDHCKKSIELGGPEEFRYENGKQIPVPHVGSDEMIDGLWLVLWCPKCNKTDRKVLTEFMVPCSSLEVWGRLAPIKPEYQQEFPGQFDCSDCGTYMLDRIGPMQCPFCDKGTLKYSNSFQT